MSANPADTNNRLPSPSERRAMHAIYAKTHEVKDDLPDGDAFRTRLLTNIFGGQPWSWHVVGVTENALRIFAQNNFKHTKGIVRAHLVDRNTMYEHIMQVERPLTCDALFDFILENDRTVLATSRENARKSDIAKQYLRIPNDNYSLFPSKFIGWRHGEMERCALQSAFVAANNLLSTT